MDEKLDYKLHCLVCDHSWVRRTDRLPVKCPNPKCQSANWAKGRPESKYKFDEIQIGETKVYKLFWDEASNQPDERRNLNMYRALKSYEYRHPGTFFVTIHKACKMYVYRKA